MNNNNKNLNSLNSRIAIIYDFDGTLSTKNMQEYTFIQSLGMTIKEFWDEVKEIRTNKEADEILSYMYHMICKAKEKKIKIKKENFVELGKKIDFFDGVDSWFERINKFAKDNKITVEHFIISSGLKEIIEGTKIKKYFKKIYASSFMYDQHDVAKFPAIAINFTNKTQYLFRINKGCTDEWDNTKINMYTPEEERYIPFRNMIFIGDGETDIPAMKLVKDKGGVSIAVYKKKKRGAKEKIKDLIKHGRVDIILPADYQESSDLDKFVKNTIEKIKILNDIEKMKKKANTNLSKNQTNEQQKKNQS